MSMQDEKEKGDLAELLMDRYNLECAQTKETIAEMQSAILELREALADCIDDQECRHDTKGYCQTHRLMNPCENAVAIEVLKLTQKFETKK